MSIQKLDAESIRLLTLIASDFMRKNWGANNKPKEPRLQDEQYLYPVYLMKDGGADGSISSVPTYTYSFTDAVGTILNDTSGNPMTGVNYNANQPNGSTIPATRGIWNLATTNPDYVLWWADEVPNTVERTC